MSDGVFIAISMPIVALVVCWLNAPIRAMDEELRRLERLSPHYRPGRTGIPGPS